MRSRVNDRTGGIEGEVLVRDHQHGHDLVGDGSNLQAADSTLLWTAFSDAAEHRSAASKTATAPASVSQGLFASGQLHCGNGGVVDNVRAGVTAAKPLSALEKLATSEVNAGVALRRVLQRVATELFPKHWNQAVARYAAELNQVSAEHTRSLTDLWAFLLYNGIRALEQSVLLVSGAQGQQVFIDLSVRNTCITGDIIWFFIAECLYLVGKYAESLVRLVSEVDISGQPIGNEEASRLVLALRSWPCNGHRTVRFVACSLTGFWLSDETSMQCLQMLKAEHKFGIRELVLNHCPVAHPSATNTAGLLDGVQILHLASTRIRSMWSLAEIVRTLSTTVRHLWIDQPPLIVPRWHFIPSLKAWKRTRSGVHASSDSSEAQEPLETHTRAHKLAVWTPRLRSYSRAVSGATSPAAAGATSSPAGAQTMEGAVDDELQTRRLRAAPIARQMAASPNPVVHGVYPETTGNLMLWSDRSAQAEVAESKLEIFLTVQVPTLESLNGTPLNKETRSKYAEYFDTGLSGFGHERQSHIVSRVEARENGSDHAKGPRRGFGMGILERIAPLRLRYDRPRARLVLPPSYRPRQFEYHPSVPGRVAVGTLQGTVLFMNTSASGEPLTEISLTGSIPQARALFPTSSDVHHWRDATTHRGTVLGLCWLRQHPETLLAGADNGAVGLIRFAEDEGSLAHTLSRFPEFVGLTSLHANASDEMFITSGYSIDVALYDIRKQQQIRLFHACHRKHINVVKFSHHAPTIFATCSFDKGVALWDTREQSPIYRRQMRRGNVMICFSPDDSRLLVSGEDNQVVQLETYSGRTMNVLSIDTRGCTANYTRSYYMRCFETDFIITGSCEESIVRIFQAETGKQLCDVEMDCIREQLAEPLATFPEELTRSRALPGATLPVHHSYVQSLRPDPFRPFAFSTLLAYYQVNVCSDIMEVNLLG
jgi:hypothetical protein